MKATIIASVIVLLFTSMTLPAVSATGDSPCSRTSSSDWTDSSLCGHGGMIAIIVASEDPTLESDLAMADTDFGLPPCTISNGCLEVEKPYGTSPDTVPSSDVSLYVEQAHLAAPGAKILVVQAKSAGWHDMYDASYWVRTQPDVDKVASVSWSHVLIELGLVLK